MANFYTAERVPHLLRFVSEARFAPYLEVCNGNASLGFDLYAWNLELGASFYAPLAILEVTVRNAIHRELIALFGVSWHRDARFQSIGVHILNAHGFTQSQYPQHGRTDLLSQPAKLDVKLHAEMRKRAVNAGSKVEPSTNDIVGALDFGYWTSLFNRDVENSLYAAGLYKAFPHAPHAYRKKPARTVIAQKLRDIRLFRNRVMHHEPLFNRKNIRCDYQNILEACQWIDIIAGEWIERLSKIENIIKMAPIQLRAM